MSLLGQTPPQSWSNYLSSTEYGAIITNNARGYGCYQSGARGRIITHGLAIALCAQPVNLYGLIIVDPDGRILQKAGERETILTEIVILDDITKSREYGSLGLSQ